MRLNPSSVVRFGSILLLLLLCSSVVGDTLHLKNGGKLSGRVVERTSTHVRFDVRGIGVQMIPLSRVERIETSPLPEDEFERRRDRLDPEDADGTFELGLWCEENGLEEQAKAMYEKVVSIEPGHLSARERLGHVRVGRAWLGPDDYRDLVRPKLGPQEALGGTKTACRLPVGWVREGEGAQVQCSSPEVHDVRLVLGVEELGTDPMEDAKTLTAELRQVSSEVTGPVSSACKLAEEPATRLEWRWKDGDAYRVHVEKCMKRKRGGIRIWAESESFGSGQLEVLIDHVAASLVTQDRRRSRFQYTPPGEQWVSFFDMGKLLSGESGDINPAKLRRMELILRGHRRELTFVGTDIILIDTSSDYAFMGVHILKSVSDYSGLPTVEDLANLRATFYLSSSVRAGSDLKATPGTKRNVAFGRMKGISEEFRGAGERSGRVVFLRKPPYWIVSVALRIDPSESNRALIKDHDKLLKTLRLP